MDDVTIARALHVLAVVLWIGGVGLVTTVLLPLLRGLPDPAQRIALFEAIEGRFAAQARFSIALAGLSGLWMLIRMNAWGRFADLSYWWLHAMLLLWLVFTALIFLPSRAAGSAPALFGKGAISTGSDVPYYPPVAHGPVRAGSAHHYRGSSGQPRAYAVRLIKLR